MSYRSFFSLPDEEKANPIRRQTFLIANMKSQLIYLLRGKRHILG